MTSKDFSVKYLKVNEKKNNLNFEISGNNEYGLNKTIINAIRRTLLTDSGKKYLDNQTKSAAMKVELAKLKNLEYRKSLERKSKSRSKKRKKNRK